MEIQTPEELSVNFHTRKQAASKLGIAAGTLDEWERKGLLKYRWLGNRKILLDSDLMELIKDENVYNTKKS